MVLGGGQRLMSQVSLYLHPLPHDLDVDPKSTIKAELLSRFRVWGAQIDVRKCAEPLSSELGSNKTVKAIFWNLACAIFRQKSLNPSKVFPS